MKREMGWGSGAKKRTVYCDCSEDNSSRRDLAEFLLPSNSNFSIPFYHIYISATGLFFGTQRTKAIIKQGLLKSIQRAHLAPYNNTKVIGP
jgi:hypothetical protein